MCLLLLSFSRKVYALIDCFLMSVFEMPKSKYYDLLDCLSALGWSENKDRCFFRFTVKLLFDLLALHAAAAVASLRGCTASTRTKITPKQ